ncbi:hypothetical protein [Lysobacter niastensis]|uniref:Uncharacterized protein n=1 Tax=Lysobacter niastensis TaxID=380629 RepID=A0ABS0B2S6_9GAMM|nr:hypothetical protein [Lysobacter niastensis]MBF6022628.1 hypothetical protein [Lysobacter niastensis]
MSYRVEIRESGSTGPCVSMPSTLHCHGTLHDAATAGRRDAHLHARTSRRNVVVRVYGETGELVVAAPIRSGAGIDAPQA